MRGSPTKIGVWVGLNLGCDIQHPMTWPTQSVDTLDMLSDVQNYDLVKN